MMNDLFSKLNLDDLNQLPNRREKMIFLVAMFVFFIVFLKSCWSPSVVAISGIKEEINVLEEQNGYLSQVISSSKTESEDNNVQNDVLKQVQYSGWAKRFADDPDATMVNDFSNPNILRDVKMGNISFQEISSSGGVIKKSFKLSLLGSFTSVGSYLVKVEELPLLLSLDSVSIKAVSGEGDIGKVSVDIEGVAYGWK